MALQFHPSQIANFGPTRSSMWGGMSGNLTPSWELPADWDTPEPVIVPTIDVQGILNNQNTPTGATLVDKLGLGLQGLQTIGNLIAGFKALGLAKKQFNFQKDFANTNLANSIQNYNTTLADKARARYAFEDRPASEAEAYIAQNSLKDRTIAGRRP